MSEDGGTRRTGIAEAIAAVRRRKGLNPGDALSLARDLADQVDRQSDEQRLFWRQAAERVAARGREAGLPPVREVSRRLTVLGLRALADGRVSALRDYASGLLAVDTGSLPGGRALRAAGRVIIDQDWLCGVEDLAAAEAAKAVLPALLEDAYAKTEMLLDALGFHLTARVAWNLCLFRHLIVPVFRGWHSRGCAAKLLALEERVYLDFVRQREDQEHLDRYMSKLAAQCATLAEPPAQVVRSVEGEGADRPTRLGFVLQYGVLAAHTQLLIENLRHAGTANREVTIYAIHPTAEFAAAIASLPVRFVPVVQIVTDHRKEFARLAERIRADRMDVIAYLSLPVWVAYLSALRMAPHQAFIAMKRHPRGLPCIDLRLSSGPVSGAPVFVNGERWVGVRPGFDNLPSRRKRQPIPDAARGPVIGTVAREEKIAQPEFLAAVSDLLQACPDAIFRFTGRSEPETIRRHFKARGQTERVKFCGWVEMAPFISELDLFLSTYPQGGGVSEVHAMALGVPVVSWVGDNGVADTVIAPALEGYGNDPFELAARRVFVDPHGHRLLPRASSPAEFVQISRDLLRSPAARLQIGAAMADFVEAHLSDPARFGDDVLGLLAGLASRDRAGAAER